MRRLLCFDALHAHTQSQNWLSFKVPTLKTLEFVKQHIGEEGIQVVEAANLRTGRHPVDPLWWGS